MHVTVRDWLVVIGICAPLGLALYLLHRAYDNHLDAPALRAIVDWSRRQGLRLMEVERRRGASGSLGKLPRLYAIAVENPDGSRRIGVISLPPSFWGVVAAEFRVEWDVTIPASFPGARRLKIPENT